MLVVIMCWWCVLGYHFSSQADGAGIEVTAAKGDYGTTASHKLTA